VVDYLDPLPQINPVPLAGSVRVRQEHSRAPLVAYLDRHKPNRALQEGACLDQMRHRSRSSNRLAVFLGPQRQPRRSPRLVEACSDLQHSRNPRQVVFLAVL
jgi:hypothetical protein